MSLVDLPSGSHAILRKKLTWGLRCRIDDASSPPPELAAMYAEHTRPDMTDAERETAVTPHLIQHMSALQRMSRSSEIAVVLAWVESWDFGDVNEASLDDIDEDDVLALIEVTAEREAAAQARRVESVADHGDPTSPTVAVKRSARPLAAALERPAS